MKNFTLKLSFLAAFLLTATLGMGQASTYKTVGIIGSATANGWTSSTAMTLVSATGHTWTITLPLVTGEAKFRANDDWAVNWGAATFPAGAGTQNGPNIPVAANGNYTVTLDDVTGAYQFTKLTASASKLSSVTTLSLSLAPNPASGLVSVAYELPTAATATITVQNLLGQTVRQFAPVQQGAGARDQQLSLQGFAPGVYLFQLKTGTQTQTARLLVQ
ncbi:MAG: hypothetical protein NVSMB30_30710 [Hymenobacter sp.]